MLEVVYHRLIQRDLKSAITHYDREGGEKLGNRFFDEVEDALMKIEESPTSHHFSDGGLRRVGLKSFPYHFLYEVDSSNIWIAVLRHDKRHPNFGLRRKR